jgi:hypothetical protein
MITLIGYKSVGKNNVYRRTVFAENNFLRIRLLLENVIFEGCHRKFTPPLPNQTVKSVLLEGKDAWKELDLLRQNNIYRRTGVGFRVI